MPIHGQFKLKEGQALPEESGQDRQRDVDHRKFGGVTGAPVGQHGSTSVPIA